MMTGGKGFSQTRTVLGDVKSIGYIPCLDPAIHCYTLLRLSQLVTLPCFKASGPACIKLCASLGIFITKERPVARMI